MNSSFSPLILVELGFCHIQIRVLILKVERSVINELKKILNIRAEINAKEKKGNRKNQKSQKMVRK